MKNHKHYETARKAHYNTSFEPEKRATTFCRGFDAAMQELENLGVPEDQRARYEALVIKHLGAMSRCFSSMIVGGGNFSVARAEKANKAERACSEAAAAYYKKIIKKAKQEARYEENPDARPVKKIDQAPSKETMIGGVKVVENTEAVRLQIFFEGKPTAAMIALLKSQAFKWAPSIQAWQRQLTDNAIFAFTHRILPELNKS